MSLVEFLFVDKPRLDSYFEQIESPVTYDKVPVWSAELSLTGPKAAGSQIRQARQWTTFEKVKALMNYLKENRLLERGREGMKRGGPGVTEFRFEKCEARRASILPDKSRFADFQGLNMWVAPSLEQPGPGMLFLIQDFQREDMPPVYTYPSGYSALLALGAEVRESLDRTLIGNLIKDKLRVSPERSVAEFAGDPIGFLKDLGNH